VWTTTSQTTETNDPNLICTAEFENSPGQAVNAICGLDNADESFACGSNDRTIRIFRKGAGDEQSRIEENENVDENDEYLNERN